MPPQKKVFFLTAYPARPNARAGLRKTPKNAEKHTSFFECCSSCLSRACLGKTIVFSTRWRRKDMRVFPMFVPSLSWLNDGVFIYKCVRLTPPRRLNRNRCEPLLVKPHLRTANSGKKRQQKKRKEKKRKEKKTPLLPQLSRCFNVHPEPVLVK